MTSKAFELARLGNAYSDGALSNRNLIINGAMQVAQRGTSFTTGGYTLDRWYANVVSSATQYTDASGQKWLDFTGNGGSWANVSQKIEDGLYRVRNQTITLSFDWEQVTAGSTAEARFYNNVDLDQYIAIPSPSVSERKVITVSIGNIGNGAGGWLGLAFYNAKATGASGRFRISNVQLEVGDTATPFEHRSYGQELALCQRFFCKSFPNDTPPQQGWNDFRQGAFTRYGGGGLHGNVMSFPVAMRAIPSITFYRPYFVSTDGAWGFYPNHWGSGGLAMAVTGISTTRFMPETIGSVGTDGNSYIASGSWSADAEL